MTTPELTKDQLRKLAQTRAVDRAWNWINMSVPQRAGEERMLKALRIALEALEHFANESVEAYHTDTAQAKHSIERMADALEGK